MAAAKSSSSPGKTVRQRGGISPFSIRAAAGGRSRRSFCPVAAASGRGTAIEAIFPVGGAGEGKALHRLARVQCSFPLGGQRCGICRFAGADASACRFECAADAEGRDAEGGAFAHESMVTGWGEEGAREKVEKRSLCLRAGLRKLMTSGRGSAWLERLVRDQEVGGSNPLAPTICFSSFDSVVHIPSLLTVSAGAAFLIIIDNHWSKKAIQVSRHWSDEPPRSAWNLSHGLAAIAHSGAHNASGADKSKRGCAVAQPGGAVWPRYGGGAEAEIPWAFAGGLSRAA
jgi:hypothetical protein